MPRAVGQWAQSGYSGGFTWSESIFSGNVSALSILKHYLSRHVACIGALTTMLALGIDPIVQQTKTISIQTRNVNKTALANIVRA